jgi:hypothetical protein
VGAGAVAGLVGLVRAVEARATLCGFLTGEVAETVVFCFGIAVGVVERWQVLVGMSAQLGNVLQREPIESISMAAMMQRRHVQGVWYQRMCRNKGCEDVLLFLSWHRDDRFGAKAAENRLAQGPDRRGARDHLRSILHSVTPRGCACAGYTASGKS